MKWPWHRNGEAKEVAKEVDQQLAAGREQARRVEHTTRNARETVEYTRRIARSFRGAT